MKVVLSSLAVADLRRIGGFIALDNPPRAASFVSELRDIAAQLADMPNAFTLVPRYERYGIRRRSWKGYGICIPSCPIASSSIASSAPARIMTARSGCADQAARFKP